MKWACAPARSFKCWAVPAAPHFWMKSRALRVGKTQEGRLGEIIVGVGERVPEAAGRVRQRLKERT